MKITFNRTEIESIIGYCFPSKRLSPALLIAIDQMMRKERYSEYFKEQVIVIGTSETFYEWHFEIDWCDFMITASIHNDGPRMGFSINRHRVDPAEWISVFCLITDRLKASQ